MNFRIFFFIKKKQFKKLFFYLSYYYRFITRVLSSEFGTVRIAKFKNFLELKGFLNLLNLIEIRKFKSNNSYNLRLINEKKVYKLIREIEEEEVKTLQKKLGPLPLIKKKKSKYLLVKEKIYKEDFWPFYVNFTKNLVSYNFFKKNFLEFKVQNVVYLFNQKTLFIRKLSLYCYIMLKYQISLYLLFFNGNYKTTSKS